MPPYVRPTEGSLPTIHHGNLSWVCAQGQDRVRKQEGGDKGRGKQRETELKRNEMKEKIRNIKKQKWEIRNETERDKTNRNETNRKQRNETKRS